MKKETVSPEMARLLVGDESAMVGSGKIVFCEQAEKTLFGGVVLPNISKITDGNWHMSVGTLIWVPLRNYVWADGICRWSIEDLICRGLTEQNWSEAKP